MKVALCIPTYNAGSSIDRQLPALEQVKALFHRTLIIDSSSTDGTPDRFRTKGYEVLTIPSIEFDHGGTRQMAVGNFSDCEIVVFLTQDAIPVSAASMSRLIAAFDDPEVVIAYGRQLPRPEAGAIEYHARLFNYPAQSRHKSRDSIPELGLRTAVVSNSFAAYRRDSLLELGGFPTGTLFGEDTLTGARAILAGRKIVYVGDAEVYHSHDYSLIEEFQRYFDNGVFYSREKWILETFGAAEGSGKDYVISEMKYLLKVAPWLLPLSAITVVVKYLGYRAGSMEKYFPTKLKLKASMNKAFWRRELFRAKL